MKLIDALRRSRPRPLGLLTQRMSNSVLVGLVAGLGACAFYCLLQFALWHFIGGLAHFYPPEAGGEPSIFGEAPQVQPVWYMLLLVPTLGGLLSGWLVFTFAPEAEGHGTDSAILAFHRLGGKIRGRVPPLKMIASALTIGSGGSGGREGPIAQIGAGFGSYLATRLHLPDRERRLLMLAGLGAGVGAIFKAPLAGAIFAGEVLYSEEELEYEALVPATVASIVAYAVFASVFGTAPVFSTPAVAYEHAAELISYGLLGVVAAGAGWLFVRCFYGARDLFHLLPMNPKWKPALGGFLTGLCGLLVPAALATSYGQVQRALNQDASLTITFMLVLGVFKILTTSLSIGSGGSGGVFGPAMVIGGSFGYATGLFCQQIGLPANPAAMCVVGMAGFFAGCAKTPLSTIIMVSEMTGNYHLLLPSMLTCTVAAVLLRRHNLYENQVMNRRASQAHTGELAIDILQTLAVGDWMEQEHAPLHQDTPLRELVVSMADALHTRTVVVDDQQLVQGILDVRDVLCVVGSEETGTIRAGDLMDPNFTVVTPDTDLHQALALLDQDTHGMLLVVRDPDEPRLLGTLRRQDVLHAYHHAGERMLQTVHRAETGAVHLPADVTVGEAMTVEFDAVPPELPLDELEALFHASGHHGFPVVDRDQRLLGIVTLSDLETVVDRTGLTAMDVATRNPVTCYPYETLVEALRKFGQKQVGRLPVVDPAHPEQLVGILRRSDVLNTFAKSAAIEESDQDAAVVHALDVPQSRFFEFTLRRGSPAVQKAVKELALPSECLLVSIRRGPTLMVPHGSTRLELGDGVTVLCAMDARAEVQAVLGSRRDL